MRWLILLPAGPGALFGGWLGEHFGLRAALAFAGGCALLLALIAWRNPVIAAVKVLPKPQGSQEWVGVEADVRPAAL
jgi:predicted MFS family arabinose efflux permease